MIRRLRLKFICINMVLVMAMLLGILVVVYSVTATGLEEDSVAVLRQALMGSMVPGRPGTGAQPCFVLQGGQNGEILVSGGEFFDLSDENMVAEIYALAQQQQEQTGILESYSLRYYRQHSPFGDRYAFVDITAERSSLQDLLQLCALIFVLGLGVFWIISIGLARWATHPVEQAWDQQRQFVADASHELKTPLTVILTNAEMLRSAEYDDAQKDRCSQSILDVSLQMRNLVEHLLQLARSDRGQYKPVLSTVDLSNLVENALLPFEPVYFEQGLLLESELESGLQVCGDASALRQVVDILLDNGQKYACGTLPAKMTLRRHGKKLQLAFFTPGDPMTPQQCRDVFRRFYRLDEARTSSGSYGLGLAIAQQIVQEHGGRIWAEGNDRGNVFVIQLPEA